MKKNEIEKVLSKKMENFEVQPHANSFSEVIIKLKRKDRRVLFLKTAMLIIGFLIVTSVAYLFTSINMNKEKLLISEKFPDKPLLNLKLISHSKREQLTKTNTLKTNKAIEKNLTQSTINTKITRVPPGETTKITDPNIEATAPLKSALVNSINNSTYNNTRALTAEFETQTNNLNNVTDNNPIHSPGFYEFPFFYLASKKIQLAASLDSNLMSVEEEMLRTQKELLNLKSAKFKTGFFVGVSNLSFFGSNQFSENKSNTQDNLALNGNAKSFYVAQRKNNNSFQIQAMPSLQLGLTLVEDLQLSISLGSCVMTNKELIYELPKDTIRFSPPVNTFSATRTSPNSAAELNSFESKNVFRSLFVAFQINKIYSLRYFDLKPGMAFSYNKLRKSNYWLLDTSGYKFIEKGNELLNTVTYNLLAKVGFSKSIFKNFEFQLSPSFIYSPSSVFSKNYFVNQKSFGYGIEAALFYKLR